eukprot:gb/GECG01013874.1/.p1 GENE.gb/GECG01013874.1/~~gb/GECG01013874.1/.p1  ORF type:complete len:166 (+),score=6.55 gb/GECG01013874.1/:1-498(+)
MVLSSSLSSSSVHRVFTCLPWFEDVPLCLAVVFLRDLGGQEIGLLSAALIISIMEATEILQAANLPQRMTLYTASPPLFSHHTALPSGQDHTGIFVGLSSTLVTGNVLRKDLLAVATEPFFSGRSQVREQKNGWSPIFNPTNSWQLGDVLPSILFELKCGLLGST